MPCFDCEDGIMTTVVKPYELTINGVMLVVPDVPQEECDKCGEACIGSEGNKLIEAAQLAAGQVYRGRICKSI
jgi:YgiT-type zinc finger domain-containing protein